MRGESRKKLIPHQCIHSPFKDDSQDTGPCNETMDVAIAIELLVVNLFIMTNVYCMCGVRSIGVPLPHQQYVCHWPPYDV